MQKSLALKGEVARQSRDGGFFGRAETKKLCHFCEDKICGCEFIGRSSKRTPQSKTQAFSTAPLSVEPNKPYLSEDTNQGSP